MRRKRRRRPITTPEQLVKPKLEQLFNPYAPIETGQAVLNDPSLWFGQTCGYPLMTSLRDTLTPISVPIFDVDGCDHTSYSSLLIVSADSEIKTLEDCQVQRLTGIYNAYFWIGNA